MHAEMAQDFLILHLVGFVISDLFTIILHRVFRVSLKRSLMLTQHDVLDDT